MGEPESLAAGGNSVKADSVQAFQDLMKDIFQGNPTKSRLIIKYRHVDKSLSIRATDDGKTVKMKTRKPGDVTGLKRLVGFVVADEDVDGMEVESTDGPDQRGGGKRKKRAKKG